MRKPRTFTAEFKRQVVEELLSGVTGPAQLCRRYNLSRGLVYHWKKQYARAKLNNEPNQEEALLDRINKLQQMVGKLTLENEFLKKALQNALKEQEKKESSLPPSEPRRKSQKGVPIDENSSKRVLL